MPEISFVNHKTGRKYKVLKFDKEAGTVTLIGEGGIEFTEPYTKERFQGLGYELQTA